MLSRRQVLASTGVTLSAGVLGGCLSSLQQSKNGHLQLKAVSLTWEYNGQRYTNEPLDLRFDTKEKEVSGQYDPDFFSGSVDTPTNVVVSDEHHRRLSRYFQVEYLIGVCGTDFGSEDTSYGCLNTRTTRADFNRVRLNSRADVREKDDRFDVIDVEEDAYSVKTTDIHTFDFAQLHEDDGINPEDW